MPVPQWRILSYNTLLLPDIMRQYPRNMVTMATHVYGRLHQSSPRQPAESFPRLVVAGNLAGNGHRYAAWQSQQYRS